MSVAQLEPTSLTTDDRVTRDLQDSLVELIEISLQAKQAHWNVVGPLFKPVHEQLDVIVDIARETSDEVAERIATLGGSPDGRSPTIAGSQPFEQLPGGPIRTEQAVVAIARVIDDIAARLHKRIVLMGDLDPISQGILIVTAERLEKQGWMLRKQR